MSVQKSFSGVDMPPHKRPAFVSNTSAHRRLPWLLGGLFIALSQPLAAGHLEHVTVSGEPLTPFVDESGLAPLAETNTALLLKRVAGANVNFNGTLAGIPQYRGMFGLRVNTDVDGMNIGNACSNHMDSPLHYVPRTFVDHMEVIRGIAPVSSGLETIGGTVVARSRTSEFATSDEGLFSGRIALGGQSVDSGYSISGDLRLANTRHSLRAAASREDGDDRGLCRRQHPTDPLRTQRVRLRLRDALWRGCFQSRLSTQRHNRCRYPRAADG